MPAVVTPHLHLLLLLLLLHSDLPPLPPAAWLGGAEADVGRQDEAPDGHQDYGEEGGQEGEEELEGQGSGALQTELEHQQVSQDHHGAA